VTTPIGAHIRETLETMWDTVVQLLLVGICFRIRFADALCDNLWVALFMTCVFTILALHAGRILQKVSAESTTHNIIELLQNELMPV
jgi:hypothetical protein